MNGDGVLGVYRERVFSPGKIDADAAVMDAALEHLAGLGHRVSAVRAEALDPSRPCPSAVLTMAQSGPALAVLAGWQARGARVVNSVGAVRNCYRKPLVALLAGAGIPIPAGQVTPVDAAAGRIAPGRTARIWLKRGDVHAVQAGDVVAVASRAEAERALDHFRRQGIADILVQAHVDGPVVKFYGVGASGFFRAYRSPGGEDVTARVPTLPALAAAAAAAVGLDVYGGDAVLNEERGAVLVDLNDWPSFSPCSRAAGAGIARHVHAAFG
jgi:glutathione synthase/RimK-type ligase-like ATP-grasp enzyme